MTLILTGLSLPTNKGTEILNKNVTESVSTGGAIEK
jgi:hypothetical protein